MTEAMPFLQKVILLSYDPRPSRALFDILRPCCLCLSSAENMPV